MLTETVVFLDEVHPERMQGVVVMIDASSELECGLGQRTGRRAQGAEGQQEYKIAEAGNSLCSHPLRNEAAQGMGHAEL